MSEVEATTGCTAVGPCAVDDARCFLTKFALARTVTPPSVSIGRLHCTAMVSVAVTRVGFCFIVPTESGALVLFILTAT